MADDEARRPKRRCARPKQNSAMPSAIHYVGYVEEDETPEMIMAKFAELERIQQAAQEIAKQAAAAPVDDSAKEDAEQTQIDGTVPINTTSAAATAIEAIFDQGNQDLTDDQLLQVFKQTSMFNVRTAMQDNAMLMGIDEVLEYTEGRYGADELPSDDEDLLKSFWSDDEDWGDDEEYGGKRGGKRRGAGGSRAPAGPRAQRNVGTTRARHNIVTAYNPATQALVRRKVRVDNPDEINQIRVPAAPLPLSWGRAVKPYIPAHLRGVRREAVPTPPAPAPVPTGDAAAAGAAGSSAPAVAVPPPCTYLELPSMSDLNAKALPTPTFQAVLINPGWERDSDASAALSSLSSLPLPRLVPTGFVFVWLPKHHVQAVCKQMTKWGYTYIENLTWVWVGSKNEVMTLPSRFVGASHLTLYMFRVADKGKDIELRHQRNPDVTFDCVAAPAEGKDGSMSMRLPEETYVAVETLLPTGKGKLLELWAEKGVKRPGWAHVVEVGGAEV